MSSTPVPRGIALLGLASSMFLVVLDAAMTNLAGPDIREGLGLSAAELTLVASSYLVPLAGLLLLGGRLADVVGGRRIYVAGMAVYLVATAFCALAVNGPMLIAGRIGQGIGGAIVIPSALALALAISTTPAARTRTVGIWGATSGAGGLLGFLLGGVLTQAFGWTAVFWAPVPIGLLSMALVLRSVPAVSGRPGRIDVPGAITITGGISAIAYGVVSASESRWSEPGSFIAIAAGLAFLAAFVAVELRAANPLVPLEVFRRGPVIRASVVVMALGGVFGSMFFLLPQYLQQVVGLEARSAGLAQAPLPLMIIVGSALAPVVARAIGLARACTAGLFLLLAGFAWLIFNPADDRYSVHLAGAFVLLGAGVGIGLVNAIAIAVRDATEGESGLLSGLVSAAQQVGAAAGVAILGGIAIGAGGELNFTTAFVSQAVLVLIAFGLSLIHGARTERTEAVAYLERV
ncbi:MFS family permease [Catenuloplanes nepalensis]|uniref:MFS family permease n=1 Tax=Catenuloplanes nepalensis TaxID=587533 RepID=A0ABT9MQ68_9ACTN|nr:MFS transporter [Catenuloplanes nepalensis]MDP9793557.1 MFS family permease [Catenuloplanes nepalensis]